MMRWVWAGAMLASFIGFSFWYGGAGAPIPAEEAAQRFERIRAAYMAAGHSGTHSDSFAALEAWAKSDDGREFFMVNLETARKTPEGVAADDAYARAVLPALLKRGSFPIYAGAPIGSVLGDAGTKIDRVVVVRYRSFRDLLDMIEDPDMVAGLPNKNASLVHTESFPTKPFFSAVNVRLSAGLILGMIGVLGWMVLSPRRG